MTDALKECPRPRQTKFSFGATSAIITNLGLIVGLDVMNHPRAAMIGGILIIALADNIADSFGIHIYQESECLSKREVWVSTFANFVTRIGVSLTFILLVLLLPPALVVPCSVVWGLLLLVFISYAISRERGLNPFSSILEHILIAVFVVVLSHFVGHYILIKSQMTG